MEYLLHPFPLGRLITTVSSITLSVGYYGCSVTMYEDMKKERETGLEPATATLGKWNSTTELLPLVYVSVFR